MKIIAKACVVITFLSLSSQVCADGVTERIKLNEGWMFQAGDTVAFNWKSVRLPHDFQISQPWVAPSKDEKANNNDPGANIKSRLSSRGFKEMGIGWYKRILDVPETMKGRRLLLDFEGIMYTGDVYLNGQRIGGTDYGYVGFEIDVTRLVRYGKPNVLCVKADTREPLNSRWYTGGGLFRDVWLITTPADMWFARHPLYITTRDNRYVNISAAVSTTLRSDSVMMEVTITAPDGRQVFSQQSLSRRNRHYKVEELRLPEIDLATSSERAGTKLQLWDCEHPALYTVCVRMLHDDGSVADETSSTFGVRTIEIVPGRGLLLNGEKVLLKGYANHHSLGALGAAVYPDAIEKRIKLIKEYGLNHIRTSHNPYSTSFLDLCDRYGILVVDELYDKWFTQYTGGRGDFASLWQHDLPEWVQRDRNHPCVVMWSFGNELQSYSQTAYNDWGVTQYRLMRTLLHRYDTTRLSTVAMHPRYRNWETDSLPCDLAMQTDVQAYNYRYMYFPGDGRRFPHMKFYQSEASMAAMGPNYFEMDLDKVIGLAYWGLIDYLGESQEWPAKGWAQGGFDLSLEPKPKAFLLKSMFCKEPMVHIGVIEKKGDVMWNGVQTGMDGMTDHWNRADGAKLNLITYTNAEEVELFLNGRSIGKQMNPNDSKNRNQIRWNAVPYEKGTLEAVAYMAGRPVARHKIETTDEAVKLKAVVEDNGKELVHVRVIAVDKKGRRVPMCAKDVHVAVSGGELIAMDNGDMNSPELHTSDHRTLYNGSVLAIVRKSGQGDIKLMATADGLKSITIKITE